MTSRLVGRASLDLATLGLKGRFLISLPVLIYRSGFYIRRSDTVSAKRPATRRDALRRRWTELFGSIVGQELLHYSPCPNSAVTWVKVTPNQALRWHLYPSGIRQYRMGEEPQSGQSELATRPLRRLLAVSAPREPFGGRVGAPGVGLNVRWY